MSAPLRMPWTCGFWPTPPKTVTVLSPAVLARGLRASLIWFTSSRVGAMISARGLRDWALLPDAARRATSGSRNAYVLPEPVRPRPSTSRPARESGSVAAWMGVGEVMPRSVRTAARGAGTPRSVKPAADTAVDKRRSLTVGVSRQAEPRRWARSGAAASQGEGLDLGRDRPKPEARLNGLLRQL